MDATRTDTREVVQNFEPVWDFEARIFELGGVPTPPKGIRQATVLYLLGALIAALIAHHLFAVIFSLLPWWLWIAITVTVAAILAMIEVQGLRAHQFIPVLGRYLVCAKHLNGWEACAADGERWRMSELALIPDGSEPEFTSMSYTGPGLILRTRDARRTQHTGRPRRGAADLTLTELPGPPLAQPKITQVPAGRTVAIRPMER